MRLPSLIAGTLTIVLFGFMAWRLLPPFQAVVATGIMCFSPYFVYLSQLARPYAIVIFLVFAATVTMFVWIKTKGPGISLTISVLCGVFAIYFQPIVLPAIVTLQAYPLLLFATKRLPLTKRRDYIIATGIFIIIPAILLIPTLQSLLSEMSSKSFKGSINLDTIRYGLIPVLGLKMVIPLTVYMVTIGIGIYSLTKQYKHEVCCLLLMTTAQIVFLLIIRPAGVWRAHVGIRYMVHLLPFMVVFMVSGISFMVCLCPGLKNQRSLFGAAIILMVLFGGYHYQSHHYPEKYDTYAINPQYDLFYPDEYVQQNIDTILPSTFYHEIAKDTADYVIAEVSLKDSFGACFQVYQRYHRHRHVNVILSTQHKKYFDTLYTRTRFKTTLNIEKVQRLAGDLDIRYLIVHKRIGDEYKNIFGTHQFFEQRAQASPIVRNQMKLDAEVFEKWMQSEIQYALDHQVIDPDYLKEISAPKIFEDDFIIVYDLRKQALQL